VVRVAGAAYLVVLGVGRLAARTEGGFAALPPEPRARRFRQGFVVDALDPKVAVAFLAFLPQFVDADRAVAPQVLVLGVGAALVAAALDCAWALAAGTASRAPRRSAGVRRALDRASGATSIALGVGAALARRP